MICVLVSFSLQAAPAWVAIRSFVLGLLRHVATVVPLCCHCGASVLPLCCHCMSRQLRVTRHGILSRVFLA